jgi:tetratricopeptide (TPR) repeat protein
MSIDKSKSESKPAETKGKPAPPAHVPIKVSPAPAPRMARLFRKVDWITFGVTTLLVFVGYYLTLAPDLTLEDSGELATASFYAGVPHPPGYPVWTIYTWLFTLIPISNIAWRVALSSAVAGAFACGLLALLVSRGSSLLLEGIAELKMIERRWENALCFVSGLVAGMLLGFNGFMWSQAVIVEVYTLSVLSFMAVLCCLFRWIYAPELRRYLYWAFFWFGICFNNHQTLIVAVLGIEVTILLAQPKLGRDLFIGNSAVYLLGLIAKGAGILTSFDNNLPLFMIYNLVGVGSIVTAVAMMIKIGRPLSEWKPVLIMTGLWILGASFYLYMPIASMTNPPLNWGYPRTVEGFKHAFTRGQYEQTNPTSSLGKFFDQVWMYGEGAIDEFTPVYLLIGLIPFLFYKKMQKRERAWLVGLTAIGLCLAVLLLILLNPNTDMQSRQQARVFFTASHIVIAIAIGYGITLIGGVLASQYQRFRFPILCGSSVAAAIELYYVVVTFENTQFPLSRFSVLLGMGLAVLFTLTILVARQKAILPLLIAIFAVTPVRSILSHWADNEQRGHLFGYWFGHDMFTPPFNIYPEMGRNAVLYGGTDPGRFNPTYMIFCESFIPPENKPNDPKFDRRDVCLITQNALADKTYLDYIRAHYNRSAQNDPYFFSEIVRGEKERSLGRTNLLARALLPLDRFFTGLGARIEKRRREQGVYPPKEIITASNEDSQQAFQDYISDAARRLQHDAQFPNEPKQVKPGEGVNFTRDGRVQVSGQIAVMAINGLLTKVIFDKNPESEFYVEESFPLDWMFPHLTPFGIIMKINRHPVPEITEEIVRKDHDFWSEYSKRLIGNWITYDTSVKEICEFALKTYRRHDFTGFTGDRKFVRDDFAKKAFSKLRSAIGWIYWWRMSHECPADLRPKSLEEQQRLLKEAEFALKQSYAFCPYSPEALHKFVTLLLGSGRVDDALLIAETSLKWDPSNPVFQSYANQLRSMGGNQAQLQQAQNQFAQLEQQFQANPTNLQLGLNLASAYIQMQRGEAAVPLLDQIAKSEFADVPVLTSVIQSYAQLGKKPQLEAALQKLGQLLGPLQQQYQADTNNVAVAFNLIKGYLFTQQTNPALQLVDELVARPQADSVTLLNAAQVYNQMQNRPKLEGTLQKLVSIIPTNPEAWYDLAAVQVTIGKTPEAIASLQKALQLSHERLTKEVGAKDLRAEVAADPRFGPLRQMPEFQQLMAPK